MAFIWDTGEPTAKTISEYMLSKYKWKKTTTYTVIGNLVSKGVLERRDPGFICSPKLSRDQAGKSQLGSLLETIYQGSFKSLFSSFLSDRKLTEEEIYELKKMIDQSKKG
jgi:predicted transcriptional regulator